MRLKLLISLLGVSFFLSTAFAQAPGRWRDGQPQLVHQSGEIWLLTSNYQWTSLRVAIQFPESHNWLRLTLQDHYRENANDAKTLTEFFTQLISVPGIELATSLLSEASLILGNVQRIEVPTEIVGEGVVLTNVRSNYEGIDLEIFEIPTDVLTEVQEGLLENISKMDNITSAARGMLVTMMRFGETFETKLWAATALRNLFGTNVGKAIKLDWLLPAVEKASLGDLVLAAYTYGALNLTDIETILSEASREGTAQEVVVQYVFEAIDSDQRSPDVVARLHEVASALRVYHLDLEARLLGEFWHTVDPVRDAGVIRSLTRLVIDLQFELKAERTAIVTLILSAAEEKPLPEPVAEALLDVLPALKDAGFVEEREALRIGAIVIRKHTRRAAEWRVRVTALESESVPQHFAAIKEAATKFKRPITSIGAPGITSTKTERVKITVAKVREVAARIGKNTKF